MEKNALTNVSFNTLKSSSEFLNLVLNNITSCVMLLDKDLELKAFNDAFSTIFSNREREDLLYKKCGEAIGCAYQVEEMKECGETSKCKYCTLREAALRSYTERKPIYKEKLSREFFISETRKEMKHLQFSARPFYYKKDYYVILIVEDISLLMVQQDIIESMEHQIEQLMTISSY